MLHLSKTLAARNKLLAARATSEYKDFSIKKSSYSELILLLAKNTVKHIHKSGRNLFSDAICGFTNRSKQSAGQGIAEILPGTANRFTQVANCVTKPPAIIVTASNSCDFF